jgi:hypothetical protein
MRTITSLYRHNNSNTTTIWGLLIGLFILLTSNTQATAQAPVVQSTTAYENSTAATSHTVTLPTGIQTGDLLVMVVRLNGSSKLSTSTGWEIAGKYEGTTSGGSPSNQDLGATYILTRTNGGTTDPSDLILSASSRIAAITYRVSGHTADPVVSFIKGTNPAKVTTSFESAGALFITGLSSEMTASVTSLPTGYSSLQESKNTVSGTASLHVALFTGTKSVKASAAEEDPAAFTASISRAHALTIAIKGSVLPTLTITAQAQEKEYYNTLTGGAGFTSFTTSGLVSGESVGSVTVAYGSGANQASAVDTYTNSVTISNATGGTFNPENYNIVYQPANLVVVPRPVTISIVDKTKVYGTVLTSPSTLLNNNQTQDFTVSGLTDSRESISEVTLTFATGAAARDDVGFYNDALILSGAVGNRTFNDNATNYRLVYQAADLTVTPKPLTITAAAQTKEYGTSLTTNSGYTAFTSSGLVTGDVIDAVSVSYNNGNGAAEPVQSYSASIQISNPTGAEFKASNYQITYAPGTLTVTPKGLTITANNSSKVYGQTPNLGSSAFTSVGLIDGDSVDSVTLTSTGTAANAVVTSYPIVPSAATGSGLGNYQIAYVNGSLSVTKKDLVISASDGTKVYGTILNFAGNEFTASGLESFDTITSVSFTSAGASPAATVQGGAYDIIPSNAQGARLGNYEISYVPGLLEVSEAPLTVKADDKSKVFGSSDPALTVSYVGLQNGETSEVLVGTLELTRELGENAGNYDITVAGLSSPNYDITFESGTFNIIKKELTVTAEDKQKVYDGAPYTDFTHTIAGFVGSDDTEVIEGSVTFAGNAVSATDAGSWVITPVVSGLSADNYSFASVDGQLVIDKEFMLVKADDLIREYDGVAVSEDELSITKNTAVDLSSVVYTQSVPRFGGSAVGAIHPGVYEIVPHGLENTNFNYEYVAGSLEIVQTRIQLDTEPSPKLVDIRINPIDNDGNTVSEIVVANSISFDGVPVVNPAIYITSVDESNGYWQYKLASGDPAEWRQVELKSGEAIVLDSDDLIRFVPNEDYYGSATFTFGAWDKALKIPVGGVVDATTPTTYEIDLFRVDTETYNGGLVYTLQKTEDADIPESYVVIESNFAGAFTGLSFDYKRNFLGSVEYIDVDVSDDGKTWVNVYLIPENKRNGNQATSIFDDEWQQHSITLTDPKYSDVRFVRFNARSMSGRLPNGVNAYFKVTNIQYTGVIPFSLEKDDASATVRPILYVTADDQEKVYDTLVYDPYTVSFEGAVPGYDIDVNATGLEVTYTVEPIETVNPQNLASAGTYTIKPSGLSGLIEGSNYWIEYVNGSLLITKKELTVIDLIGNSKVYDGTTSATVSGTARLSGVAGQDVIVLGGTASYTFGQRTVGDEIPITTVGFTISGDAVGNYTLTQPVLNANITLRDLYITADAFSKTYGFPMEYQGNEFRSTTPEEYLENGPSGLVEGDDVVSVSFASTGDVFNAPVLDAANERAIYPVIPSAATGTGLSNYLITYLNGSLSIDPKLLFVQANNSTKEYDGTPQDPSIYTVTVDGFAPGEGLADLDGELVFGGEAIDAIELGFYPISPGGVTSSNYDINFINGILSIIDTTPPIITVTEPSEEENESLEYTFDKETYKGTIDITVPEGTVHVLTLGTNEVAELVLTEDLLGLFSIDENGKFSFKSPGVIGVYTAIVTATDARGNQSQITITVRVVDVTSPDIFLVQPLSEDALLEDVADTEVRRLEVTIRDGSSFVAQLGSNEPVTWVTSFLPQDGYDTISGSTDDPYSTPSGTEDDLISIDADGNISFKNTPLPGVYYVNVFAIDESGNLKRVAVKINVLDYIPPVITITEPEESEIVLNPDTNRLEVEIVMKEDLTDVADFDSNEPVKWTLAGGPDEDLFTIDQNGKLTFKDLSVYGVYYVVLKATDELGNETLVYVKVTVIDDVPPVINISEPNSNNLERVIDPQTNEEYLELTIYEDDQFVGTFVSNEDVTWSLEGADADLFEIDENGNLTFRDPSEVGTYNLVVKGTDQGGNEATINVRVNVKPRDLTPPSLTVLEPENVQIQNDPSNQDDFVEVEIYEDEQFVVKFGADEDVNWALIENEGQLLTVNNNGEVGFVDPSIPGQYTVLLQVTDNFGNTTIVRVNIKVLRLYRISGYLFEDLNGNGVRDEGEPSLTSWNVSLASAETTLTKSTDANGRYVFEKFTPGTYNLTAEVKSGYLIDTPINATKSLSFGDQTSKQLQDFPYYRHVSMGGLTYNDIDGSRTYSDDIDTINPNALIELKNEDNQLLATTRSDASGRYTFGELKPGRYVLSINVEGADRRVSQPYGFTTADEYNLLVESNANSMDLDFGIYVPILLEGTVFVTAPKNGNYVSNGQPLPPGVSVIGVRTGPAPMKTTIGTQPSQDIEVFLGELDEFGNFRFEGILPGTYEIGAKIPGAWLSTTDNPITKVVQKTEFVEVGFGITVDPEAPAELMESSISGTVFLNIPIGQNLLTSEPDRIDLQTVTLTGLSQRGTAIERTVSTDRRGFYIFDQLPAGRYKLVVSPSDDDLSVDLPLNTAHYVDLDEQDFLGGQNFDRLDPIKVPFRRDYGHAMVAVLVDTDLDGKADTRVDLTTKWNIEMQSLDPATNRKMVILDTVTGLGVNQSNRIATATQTRSNSEGYVQYGDEDPYIRVSSELSFTLADRTVRTEKEVEWIGSFTKWPIRHTVLTAKEPVLVRDRFGKISGRILAAELRPMSGFDYTLDRADFGDAPASYGTNRATVNDDAVVVDRRIVYPREGARHLLPPVGSFAEVFLGSSVAAMPNGLPSNTASNSMYDDGVVLAQSFTQGDTVKVTIKPNGSAFLNAWADWNGSGYFDMDEKIIDKQFIKTNTDSISFKIAVPLTAKKGNTYLRFRYSTEDHIGPTGLALNGEVEDYVVEIVEKGKEEGVQTSLGDDSSTLPSEFALGQNFPNPFNPTTVIPFDLPTASTVRLAIYDVTGRLVRTLIQSRMEAGRHQISFNASSLSSGVYLIRLEAGAKQFTSKMTLIK